MLRDFVFAYRLLRKTPIATIVAVVALALGIGANASCFNAVQALLLRPFAYPSVDRIMTVWESVPELQSNRQGVAPANLRDWQEQSSAFETLAAYRQSVANITGADRPQRVRIGRVTPGFFHILGMTPKIGGTFTDADLAAGNERIAVVSERFWRSRLGAAADVQGTAISVGGQSYSIAGVMPDAFDYPLATDLWIPLRLDASESAERDLHSLMVVGLLKPSVAVEQARTEMAIIAERLAALYPQTNAGRSVTITPLNQTVDAVTRGFVIIVAAAALFLLLLAGANVANIHLARAVNRQRSIAIESALGASRYRIARSLCAESLLVALCGGILGLVAAVWFNDINRASIPEQVYQWIPGMRNLSIDASVVFATLSLSLVTGIVCSLPAIIQLLGRQAAPAAEWLSHGGRSLSGDGGGRLRNLLVIGEVAVALLLLVGARVMVDTFRQMVTLNLGYNAANLLTAQIALPASAYSNNTRIAAFYDRLLPELASIPNVTGTAIQGTMGTVLELFAEGRPRPTASDLRPDSRVIDEHYFQTMQIPLLNGRGITADDTAGRLPVVVISKSVADYYWPSSNAVGRRIRFGQSPWLTIVGVAGDTNGWFFNSPEPAVYAPFRQVPLLNTRLLLRTSVDPLLLANAVAARVRSVDAAEPLYEVKSEEGRLFEERSGVEASAKMMTGNAVIALFLAVTGIYGVISYFVSQRTKEIGIRMALGANAPEILKLTIGQATRVAGIGLLIGLPASYALMRLLSSLLFNVAVVRWTMFLGMTVLLAFAALAAAYIPARRAAAVDPVVALRNE